jgi:hypothetical protein
VTGAAQALAAATRAGVRLRLHGAGVKVAGRPEAVPPDILAELRRHRTQLVELLRGQRCRYCGGAIAWQKEGGVAFADGQGAHVDCYRAAETARQGQAVRR